MIDSPRHARLVEWILLAAIVLIAIIFRLAQFGQVPPGLHYDEAIDAHLAQEIRSGAWPIYFEEGWGREPLYHYVVAFTLNFMPDPTSALRLVSGLLGLIQLLAAYFLFRRMFGVPTALIGAAWIAVLFWTVSTSRAGLRNITLTTLATLTALAFWRVWSDSHRADFILHPSAFILPGLLLGLTLYTYQPSRVVPLIFLAFVVYLFCVNRPVIATRWKALLVFFGLAVVLAVPLVYFLATHPNAETGREFQTEPIRALLKGDASQIVETALATLKMFTFDGAGDPQPIYNVPGRPLFVGIGAILFYAGLLVCLWRWRRPPYAFSLIWLIVALLPNLITAPAPFFYRAIAAQTPVAVLPALGAVSLSRWIARGAFVGGDSRRRQSAFVGRDSRHRQSASVGGDSRRRQSAFVGGDSRHRQSASGGGDSRHRQSASGDASYNKGDRRSRLQTTTIILVGIVSLVQTAVTTWRDYFDVWGQDQAVRFQYSAAHTAIAHALDASTDATPVAISGYFAEDADPYIFEQTLRRRDLAIRWFDARSALVMIAAAREQRVALPSFTPLDGELAARFLPGIQPITPTRDFTLYPFDVAAFRNEIAAWGGALQTPDGARAMPPVSFDDNVRLLGYQRPASVARSESTLALLTAWRVTSEWQPSSTAIFAHLIDASGNLVAQDDRLGFPRHSWQAGDEFVQVHHISIASLAPGRYTLQLGLYTRGDNTRWVARDGSGHPIGDRVLLGQVEVLP
ncbi:MAG TPA: glycosyltransferase family 39 protein [Anaerolineae bacterium]|nr:glycosyltransferase family 39 protein [Anaerolineae bacterium]